MEARHTSQEVVISIQAVGRLTLDPFDLRLFEFGSNGAHNTAL